MPTVDEHLKALAKIPGAEAFAKKAIEALKEERDENEVQLAEAATARKDLAKVTRDRDALKRDLDGAGAKTEDTVKLAQKDRDEWKAKAEANATELVLTRRRQALADELNIADPVRRAHAVEAAYKKLPDNVTLDEKSNKLVGAAKFVGQFKSEASFYWSPEELAAAEEATEDEAAGGAGAGASARDRKIDKGNGGKPGAKKTLKDSGTGNPDTATKGEKVDKWRGRFGHTTADNTAH